MSIRQFELKTGDSLARDIHQLDHFFYLIESWKNQLQKYHEAEQQWVDIKLHVRDRRFQPRTTGASQLLQPSLENDKVKCSCFSLSNIFLIPFIIVLWQTVKKILTVNACIHHSFFSKYFISIFVPNLLLRQFSRDLLVMSCL